LISLLIKVCKANFSIQLKQQTIVSIIVLRWEKSNVFDSTLCFCAVGFFQLVGNGKYKELFNALYTMLFAFSILLQLD